jgi:hypothetical protein
VRFDRPDFVVVSSRWPFTSTRVCSLVPESSRLRKNEVSSGSSASATKNGIS